MNQTLASPDPLLVTIVLATLAVGLPIVFALSIRFLWDRNLNLGRSKELEKLIWQLHRIATAQEHQLNLSFPPVQPGTEEPRDIAFLQQLATQPSASAQTVATLNAAAAVGQAGIPRPEPPEASPAVPQQAPVSLPPLQEPAGEVSHRAGVNSMFGL
jgi:hypothetical protein